MMRNEDLGKLLVRLSCGMLFFHGLHTAMNGLDFIKDKVREAGLPEFVSYGNIVGELIAPVFLVIGFKSRIAGLIIAFNMLMSILLAHRDIAFQRGDFGGWMIELNVFYLATGLAVFFMGSGKYSLSRGRGLWD